MIGDGMGGVGADGGPGDGSPGLHPGGRPGGGRIDGRDARRLGMAAGFAIAGSAAVGAALPLLYGLAFSGAVEILAAFAGFGALAGGLLALVAAVGAVLGAAAVLFRRESIPVGAPVGSAVAIAVVLLIVAWDLVMFLFVAFLAPVAAVLTWRAVRIALREREYPLASQS